MISIENGKAKFYVIKINELICTEDWDCTGWGDCVDDLQIRACVDSNNCGTTEDKPDEEQDCGVEEGNVDELENKRNEVLEKARSILPDEMLSDFETMINEATMEELIELEESIDDYVSAVDEFSDELVFDHPDISIEILTNKNSYEMGELVEGDFHLSYAGDSFTGVVLYEYSRTDCPEKYYTKMRGTISTGSFDDGTLSILRWALKAFKLQKSGSSCSYGSSSDYFYEEATYGYGLSVYNCSLIEQELSSSCADADGEDIAGLAPMEYLVKNIVVEGGTNPTECDVRADCTELCEGCDDGTQICEQASEKCIDCFINSQCKEGYECSDNDECVLE